MAGLTPLDDRRENMNFQSVPRTYDLRYAVNVGKEFTGGKAEGLAGLSAIPQINTPEGFVLTAINFDDFIAENCLQADIEKWNTSLLKSMEESSAAALSEKIQNAILDGKFPTAVVEAIKSCVAFLRSRIGGRVPLITRSSASSEDSLHDSQAGLYHSEFPIHSLDDTFAGILRVWASGFSVTVREHWLRIGCQLEAGAGPPWRPSAMAVVVQELVVSRCSGVAFNRDVRDGRSAILIEVVPGLGETLVSGERSPQHWLFDSTGMELLEKRLVPQVVGRFYSRKKRIVETRDVPARLHMRELLTFDQAREIALTIIKISESRPDWRAVDTEFAIDRHNKLHFVQARPQTRLTDGDPWVSGVSEESVARHESKALWTGGETASLGAATGRLLVINLQDSINPERDNLVPAKKHLQSGDVLITPTTNIGWTGLLGRTQAIVAERGGIMSHTGITAREREVPAIVGAWAFISHLEQHCAQHHLPTTTIEPGAWSLPAVTIDANNRRLFLAPVETSTGHLMEFLNVDVPPGGAGYYDNRVEFAHFVDDFGCEWTGKPEHPLCPLQFELYFKAWKWAFKTLNFSAAERLKLPLMKSVAIPAGHLTAERMIGRIRVGADTLERPHEHFVVAFPTASLAQLGDRIRQNGLSPITPDNPRRALDDIMRYHEERKETYRKFVDMTNEMEQAKSASEIDFERVFNQYIELISFAHVRAAFRRRVAGPLMAAALGSLPRSVQRYCRAMLLRSWTGISTETTHCRDVEYYRILQKVTAIPSLRNRLLAVDAGAAVRELRAQDRRTFRLVVRLASRFKIERSQPDRFEDRSSIRLLVGLLCQDLAHIEATPSPHPVFTRTREGYLRELERLRSLVLEVNPEFDFEGFKQIMVIAWEVPSLTDGERHAQHRCHFQLRRLFRQIEPVAMKLGLISPGRHLLDLSPNEFLDLFNSYRLQAGGRP